MLGCFVESPAWGDYLALKYDTNRINSRQPRLSASAATASATPIASAAFLPPATAFTVVRDGFALELHLNGGSGRDGLAFVLARFGVKREFDARRYSRI